MNGNQKNYQIRASVLVAYILVILVNTLAITLPINGIAANEVSDMYANLFAPAGVTFSIWSLIFISLGGYVVAQWRWLATTQSGAREKMLNQVGAYFVFSSLLNAIWVYSWHYLWIWLSVIIMISLLASLMAIVVTIRRYAQTYSLTIGEQLGLRLPFSLYVAWISVATIANITTFLVSLGVDGFGSFAILATIVMIIVGALIGIVTAIRLKDFIYALVIVWGYCGIIIQHLLTFEAMYPAIIWTASIACVCLVGASGVAAYQEFFKK
ncbi:MAG: tryptophan-rich sensory protein [Culicoidibacterales bacterium]